MFVEHLYNPVIQWEYLHQTFTILFSKPNTIWIGQVNKLSALLTSFELQSEQNDVKLKQTRLVVNLTSQLLNTALEVSRWLDNWEYPTQNSQPPLRLINANLHTSTWSKHVLYNKTTYFDSNHPYWNLKVEKKSKWQSCTCYDTDAGRIRVYLASY